MSFGVSDDALCRHYAHGAQTSHLEGLRAVSRLTAAAGIRTVLRPPTRTVKPAKARRPPAPSTIEGRVFLALRSSSSPRALARALGLKPTQVSGALRRLADKGFAKRAGRGLWGRR